MERLEGGRLLARPPLDRPRVGYGLRIISAIETLDRSDVGRIEEDEELQSWFLSLAWGLTLACVLQSNSESSWQIATRNVESPTWSERSPPGVITTTDEVVTYTAFAPGVDALA